MVKAKRNAVATALIGNNHMQDSLYKATTIKRESMEIRLKNSYDK